jgi:hypothetical protein
VTCESTRFGWSSVVPHPDTEEVTASEGSAKPPEHAGQRLRPSSRSRGLGGWMATKRRRFPAGATSATFNGGAIDPDDLYNLVSWCLPAAS